MSPSSSCGTGGRRVELRRPAQVLQRGVQLAADAVGHAALEVREHRVRPQRDRAAVGLERLERLVGRDRLVAGRNQPVVLAVGGVGRVHTGPAAAAAASTRRANDIPAAQGDDSARQDSTRGLRGLDPRELSRPVRDLILHERPDRSGRSRLGGELIDWMESRLIAEQLVKNAGALGWSEVGTGEAALIQRCAAGEQAACAELVASHERMVFQLALHLLGDRDEALDLSQEVFLRVFRTLHAFRGQSALRTWIYRIAINQARNRQRWWRRRRRSDQVQLEQHVLDHGELRQPGDGDAPDRAFARKEMAARLWAALDALPFDQRTVIVLREIDGLSYDEIAESLDVAVGTVKSRLTRARQTLRRELQEVRA